LSACRPVHTVPLPATTMTAATGDRRQVAVCVRAGISRKT
jgi:hypothetical protein